MMVYLDIGSGAFNEKPDWACDSDGCEQRCGENAELHGDVCWPVKWSGWFDVGDWFSECCGRCTELCVANDRCKRVVD
jgi:hypothetical protein